MKGISSKRLLEIANRIGDNQKLEQLALNLNFNMADAERFKKMNRINGEVSTEGTSKMLSSWKEDTPRKDQRAQLKSALVEAKLAGIADEYFGEEMRAKRIGQTCLETPEEEGGEEMSAKRVRQTDLETPNEEGCTKRWPVQHERMMNELRMEHQLVIKQLRMEQLKQLIKQLRMEQLKQLKQQQRMKQLRMRMDALEELMSSHSLAPLQEYLERLYKNPDRFSDGIILQKQDFLPVFRRRSGEIFRAMESSRHDIFTSSTEGQQSRRKLVSGNNTAENTGLCHSLAYDWATQEKSSLLSQKQILFEISASQLKWNQTIEGAINDQLFSDLDKVDDDSIRQLLTDMSDAITILIDGFDGKHVRNYGDNIMDVLKGHALQEVTVMVTSRPRSANQLDRLAPGVYDHIDMQ